MRNNGESPSVYGFAQTLIGSGLLRAKTYIGRVLASICHHTGNFLPGFLPSAPF